MKTAIVTDSNSGIFPQKGEELGIFVLPMPVILDGQQYFEGVDLTPQAFYQRLEDGADASTSQPAPGDVIALWERVLGQGYDQIVHIPMSSGLSASCATAQGLAADFDGKIQVADNHRVSVSQYDAVMDAIALAREGLDAAAIRRELEAGGMDSVIYLGVDTLKFFKKNGRCTAATAALGTVLNIKPLHRQAPGGGRLPEEGGGAGGRGRPGVPGQRFPRQRGRGGQLFGQRRDGRLGGAGLRRPPRGRPRPRRESELLRHLPHRPQRLRPGRQPPPAAVKGEEASAKNVNFCPLPAARGGEGQSPPKGIRRAFFTFSPAAGGEK